MLEGRTEGQPKSPEPPYAMIWNSVQSLVFCSDAFAGKPKIRELLRYMVECYFRGDTPTMGTVGIKVWGKSDPKNVTEGFANLRIALASYASSPPAANDPIRISIPKPSEIPGYTSGGGYRAHIRFAPHILASEATFAEVLSFHYDIPTSIALSWFHGNIDSSVIDTLVKRLWAKSPCR
jgi:hypothetical protein